MGRPLPSISWLENSIQLKNQSHGIQIKNKVAGDILSSKLTIQSIAYWNNGSFTCVASNRHGSVKHTAPVHVHGMFHCGNQCFSDDPILFLSFYNIF